MADVLKVTISAEPTFESLAKQVDFTASQMNRIGADAINRSLTTVRSRVVKLLAANINMRQKDIRDLTVIRKANKESLNGEVSVSRKRIALTEFIGTRPTKQGVSVKVRKGAGAKRELLQGSFIAKMKTGHVGVFERSSHLPTKGPNVGARLKRRGKNGRVAGDPKYRLLPNREYRAAGNFTIAERFGLTLTGYLSNAPEVIAQEQAAAGDVLARNLISQMQRRLAQWGKK